MHLGKMHDCLGIQVIRGGSEVLQGGNQKESVLTLFLGYGVNSQKGCVPFPLLDL